MGKLTEITDLDLQALIEAAETAGNALEGAAEQLKDEGYQDYARDCHAVVADLRSIINRIGGGAA